MLDSEAGWLVRAAAAGVLATAGSKGVVAGLLDQFFKQEDKIELRETALTIESFGNRAAVGPLVAALYDANPHRRHAAARALGWIPEAGKRAAKALVQALSDNNQPQPVREEAAESLAYLNYAPAIPALISALDEPDVRIRFWAVFALGGIAQSRTFVSNRSGRRPVKRIADRRVIEALERMLADREVPPGNWWPVGREALAMLGHLEPKYRAKLDKEILRVLRDKSSSAEDIRWAEGYGGAKTRRLDGDDLFVELF